MSTATVDQTTQQTTQQATFGQHFKYYLNSFIRSLKLKAPDFINSHPHWLFTPLHFILILLQMGLVTYLSKTIKREGSSICFKDYFFLWELTFLLAVVLYSFLYRRMTKLKGENMSLTTLALTFMFGLSYLPLFIMIKYMIYATTLSSYIKEVLHTFNVIAALGVSLHYMGNCMDGYQEMERGRESTRFYIVGVILYGIVVVGAIELFFRC